MSRFLFHCVGILSAFSLCLVLALVIPGFFRGDFLEVRNFFKVYPGSQPFVIFIFPIILIIGSAWVWQFLKCWKK